MRLARELIPAEVLDDEVRNCAVCAVAVGYWDRNEFVKVDPEVAVPVEGRGWRCGAHR